MVLSSDSKNLEILEIKNSDREIKVSSYKFFTLERTDRRESNFGNLRFVRVSGKSLYVIPVQKYTHNITVKLKRICEKIKYGIPYSKTDNHTN